MTDIKEFVDRYVNIWNEPDAERRRQTVRELWQEDARHLARTIEAIGHDGIETRVRTTYEKWVKEKGNIFRLRDGVDSHHETVKLRWGDVARGRRRGHLDRFRFPGAGRRRAHPHRLPVH